MPVQKKVIRKLMGKAKPGAVGGSIGQPAPRKPKRYTRAK